MFGWTGNFHFAFVRAFVTQDYVPAANGHTNGASVVENVSLEMKNRGGRDANIYV